MTDTQLLCIMGQQLLLFAITIIVITGKVEKRDVAYWRNAYEALVKQTWRDLNDGLGPDPRGRRS